MNQITDTIQNIFSDRPLQEDEYRNEADHHRFLEFYYEAY